jgi:hypothetical protein
MYVESSRGSEGEDGERTSILWELVNWGWGGWQEGGDAGNREYGDGCRREGRPCEGNWIVAVKGSLSDPEEYRGDRSKGQREHRGREGRGVVGGYMRLVPLLCSSSRAFIYST